MFFMILSANNSGCFGYVVCWFLLPTEDVGYIYMTILDFDSSDIFIRLVIYNLQTYFIYVNLLNFL
jgi:hypothetical protein